MIATKRSCVTLFTAVICLGFISTDSAYQLVEDGNTFYANGNYQDARSMYERAEGLKSDSAGIQYNLGNVHFKQFQLARATESYKRVLLMGDTHLQSLAAYNLGNIRYQQTLNALSTFKDSMRHIKIAIRYYRESLSINPDSSDARYNLELAHRLYGEIQKQGIVIQRSPQISDRETSVGAGRQMDMETPNPSSSEGADTEEQSDDISGQAGEKAPDGSPASRTKSESQPNASPRDISEEEAAQMAELVRDKALAAENQRQQWKRARMRDTGEAKTW